MQESNQPKHTLNWWRRHEALIWRQRHRYRSRYLSYRNTMKTFLRHYAKPDDLKDAEALIKRRRDKFIKNN